MSPDDPTGPEPLDRERRLLALRTIELCAAVFRGLDRERCEAMFESAIPDLLAAPGAPADFAAPLRAMDASGSCDEVAAEYVRLFVNAPGGVPAPLYESCHVGGGRVMGDSALAMRRRLESEGLAVALPGNEPPDHLALELEYLFHLLAGEREEEARRFAGETMLPWVEIFIDRVAGAEPDSFHRHAAGLTLAVLRLLAGRS